MGIRSRDSALVLCTRNRPDEAIACIGHILDLTTRPGRIIVVDSSDDQTVLQEFVKTLLDEHITLLQTTHGLPHQRREGYRALRDGREKPEVIFFVDDDVRPCATFFSGALKTFNEVEACDLISGWDSQRGKDTIVQKFVWRLFGYASRSSGSLLKSGVGIMPVGKNAKTCPINLHSGMAFGVRFAALHESYFNVRLRMIGEDVDFFLRGGFKGRAFTGSELEVIHLESKLNRGSLRLRQKHDLAFRRELMKEFPQEVSWFHVYVWDVMLTMKALSLSFFSRNERQVLLGIIDFFRDTCLGKETRDLVN